MTIQFALLAETTRAARAFERLNVDSPLMLTQIADCLERISTVDTLEWPRRRMHSLHMVVELPIPRGGVRTLRASKLLKVL